jgi:hypothetical protein
LDCNNNVAAPFPFVLNVAAGPAPLSEDAAQAIATAAKAAAETGAIDWLAPRVAFDIPFRGDPDAIRAAMRESVQDAWLLDANVVPTERRRKTLLVADMDSTIIGCECIDELADMAGLKPKVAAITERAMRGELDFPAALRERVALLKGLKLEALARVYAERVRLNPGARAVLATMRAHGAHSVLVSGPRGEARRARGGRRALRGGFGGYAGGRRRRERSRHDQESGFGRRVPRKTRRGAGSRHRDRAWRSHHAALSPGLSKRRDRSALTVTWRVIAIGLTRSAP